MQVKGRRYEVTALSTTIEVLLPSFTNNLLFQPFPWPQIQPSLWPGSVIPTPWACPGLVPHPPAGAGMWLLAGGSCCPNEAPHLEAFS